MKYIGFILLAVIIAIILLLLIAVIRTLLMPGKTSSYVAEEPEEESLALAQKLSKMIQYDTTSHANVAEVRSSWGSTKCWRNCFLWYMRNWKRQRLTATCYFTGREKALRSRSCS